MKKIFTKISFLLLVLFNTFIFKESNKQIIFSSYPSVDVVYDSKNSDLSVFYIYNSKRKNWHKIIGKKIKILGFGMQNLSSIFLCRSNCFKFFIFE